MAGRAEHFVVTEREAGWRLDVFLAAVLGQSRSRVRGLLARGAIRVDERPVPLRAKGRVLVPGQAVAADCVREASQETPIAEPDAPLRVLAEGRGWVAVDKPPGVAVHPLDPGERGTVLNALVARRPEIVGVGEAGLRSGVVHRLDVETSGVLLFATTEARFAELRGAFRRHRVAKCYRAVVAGALRREGELVLELAVSRHRPARVRVVAPGDPAHGRRSRRTSLRYRPLRELGGGRATLVEVRPRTGFLHQIRVSLSHLGHPILGDTAYGGPQVPGVARHLLHACHVATRDVDVTCPDAPDLASFLAGADPSPKGGGVAGAGEP